MKFAFDIYDFEGKSRIDAFYLGDCLRGLNTNPTLKAIEKYGGAKKKGEKFLTMEDVGKIYGELKKSKEKGSFEDFVECLKLYDKQENGTMMLGELEHILLSLGNIWFGFFNQLKKSSLCISKVFISSFSPATYNVPGEKLEREEVDVLLKECCEPEDDDGFIPYESKEFF